ncbi:hypothetical protein C2845_PM11G03320 [Panicum miliaceum]|uniref:[RNA-polymerase]-subunit kinase n=1 Tax=Panicum miliaceum TaxID=4540 RepID=A0A3L6RNZ4_PANMI|nr:hypothetical protein C2845_PM11G03320 [Panicum miliaceum]
MASSARSSLNRRAAAAAADAPWPPEIEERYQRLEKLGEGIFGRVYKARDRADSNQIVAVKQLCGRGGGPSVQTGFLELAREVTSLNRCRGHPSIVEFRNTLVDKRDGDGDSFIVMEYAGRMNLRTYMVSRGIHGLPFCEAEVRGIMRQLLAAVEMSHRAGVLHRDVKPENVVVDDATADRIRNPAPDVDDDDDKKKDRRQRPPPPPPPEEITCKVCDFGASEPMTEGGREYSPLATSDPYRAPELFLGSADYDGRIDTWGLGCVMAELLVGTGGAFFEGKTEEDVLANMLEVVGARGIQDWLGPHQPAGSGGRSAAEERARDCPEAGRLREVFPEKVLSQAGFEVLSGLLESSPGGRLTAAEALQKPWFADDDQRTDERRREGPRRRGLGACFMSCVTDDD